MDLRRPTDSACHPRPSPDLKFAWERAISGSRQVEKKTLTIFKLRDTTNQRHATL